MNIDNQWMNDLEWQMASNNLEYFMHNILGYDVEPFHREWIDIILNNHRSCIICSRDHGKSILVSLCLPLWHMLFSPQINPLDKIDNYDSIIVSNSLHQSTELISRIKSIIETNDFLSTISFDRTSKSKVKILEKGNRNRIDSLSFGSSIRGAHPRMVIVDDPLNERDSNEHIYKFFMADMLPLVKFDGYCTVVGTPFSYDDIYSELKKPEKGFKVVEYPAIHPKTNEVLWPSRWPMDKLLERKSLQGDWLFAREYLCNPVNDETSIFPGDLVKSCIDLRIGFEQEPNPNCRYVLGQDFSIGTKSSSDYSVATVIKDDYKGNLTVAEIWRENQVDYEEQINAVTDLHKKYKFTQILVEDNAFQAVFKQILAKKFLPVKGFTTSRSSKERIIYQLHNLMENKIITLPKGSEESKELINRLETELLSFGYNNGKLEGRITHDDMVISLAIAVEAATSLPKFLNDGALFYHKTEQVMDIGKIDMEQFKAPYSLTSNNQNIFSNLR